VSLISTNLPCLGPMLFPPDLQCSSVYSSLRFSLTIRIVPLLLKDWSFLALAIRIVPLLLRDEFPSMSNRAPSVLHPATSVLGPFPGLSQTDSWDQSHSLISNFGQRSRPESPYPSLMTSSRICSRCLTNAHELRFCRAPIKCRACLHWGHIMVNCPVRRQGGSKLDVVTMPANGKAILEQPNTFNAPHGPGPSKPPVFESFAHWAASHL